MWLPGRCSETGAMKHDPSHLSRINTWSGRLSASLARSSTPRGARKRPWTAGAIGNLSPSDVFALPKRIHYNAIIDCTVESTMASITIRNLDEQIKAKLRLRAAKHQRSMEDEARNILRAALIDGDTSSVNLADAIRRRFKPLGGVELRLPERDPMREPPTPGK